MGLVDAFSAEKRFDISYSEFYALTKSAVKAELLMNAIITKVPYSYILKMMTGEEENNG